MFRWRNRWCNRFRHKSQILSQVVTTCYLWHMLQICDNVWPNLWQSVTKSVTCTIPWKTVDFMMTFEPQKMSFRKIVALDLRIDIIPRDPCTQIVGRTCMEFRKIDTPLEFTHKKKLWQLGISEIWSIKMKDTVCSFDLRAERRCPRACTSGLFHKPFHVETVARFQTCDKSVTESVTTT